MMHLTPRFVRWCSDGELARAAWPEEPVVRLLVKFIRERIIAGTTPAAGRLVAGDPSSVCCVSVMVSVVRSGIGVAVGRSASQSPGQPARADNGPTGAAHGRTTSTAVRCAVHSCSTLTFRPGVEVWIIGSFRAC
jgi:hypothetical protein